MKAFLLVIFTFLVLSSCQRVQSGRNVKKSTVKLIRELGLLGEDEQIIKYYSNFVEKKAGNFYTNKRIAHYWLDDNDPAESDTTFAFYRDILAIDTVYAVPDTFAPYMDILKSDSTRFKVFVEGRREQVKAFFEGAMQLWKKYKNQLLLMQINGLPVLPAHLQKQTRYLSVWNSAPLIQSSNVACRA